MSRFVNALALCFCILAVFPATAKENNAQRQPSKNRLKLNLTQLSTQGGAFLTSNETGSNSDASLNGVGVGLSLDVPIIEYLSAGALVGATFASLWPQVALNNNYESVIWFDFDAFVKGRYPIVDFHDQGHLALTLAVPAGLTVFRGGETSLGWNISALPGAEVFFTRHFGLFLEGGFVYHSGVIEGSRMCWAQAALNFGASYAF